jgi:porin
MFLSSIPLLAQDPAAAEASRGILPVPDYSGDLATRSFLAGDVGGQRAALAEQGVQAQIDWTQTGQSIVSGGRDNDAAYGGKLDTLIRLDLMRMGVIDGGLLTLRAESRYGESVNAAAGPLLPVNTNQFFPLTDELDDGLWITITNLKYTQFLSEQVAIFGGKIDTLDGDPNEFASGRGKTQFLNAQFVFNPVVALRMPYSTLGAGVVVLPNDRITVSAVVFNTLDSSTTTGFDDFGEGTTATLEGNFQYRLGELPGGFNVGGLYSWDQDFTQINGELIFVPDQGILIPNADSTWAIYTSVWQYVWTEEASDRPIRAGDGVPDLQGIGVFGRLGFADEDTNPIEWTASVGVGGRGVIPGRDLDTFGIGYSYSSIQETLLSAPLGIDDSSQAAEAYYSIAITPAVNLDLDVQVADSPFAGADTAVILGMRLNIRF